MFSCIPKNIEECESYQHLCVYHLFFIHPLNIGRVTGKEKKKARENEEEKERLSVGDRPELTWT